MEKDTKTLAIVINVQESGERGMKFTLLSTEKGIMDVFMYGSRKSSKGVKPFLYTEANFSLFRERENGRIILKDLDILKTNDYVFQDYEKTVYMAFLSELVIKLREAGSNTYFLFALALDYLEGNSVEKVFPVILSHLLYSEGLISDFSFCPGCQREYDRNETVYFSSVLSVAVCKNCTDQETLILPPNARLYLKRVLELKAEDAINCLSVSSIQAKRITLYLVKTIGRIMPERLNSISLLLE